MHTKVCVSSRRILRCAFPGTLKCALPVFPVLGCTGAVPAWRFVQASVRKQLCVSFSELNRRLRMDFESGKVLRKMGRAEESERRIG